MIPAFGKCRWADLFSAHRPDFQINHLEWEHLPLDPKQAGTSCANRIGEYCIVRRGRGHESCHVRPTPQVIEWIRDNMLTEQGPLYFEVIQQTMHPDELHVFVKYNQILGSRKLGEIPASDVPANIGNADS